MATGNLKGSWLLAPGSWLRKAALPAPLALVPLLSTQLDAQEVQPPPQHVVHLYVDPHYGDDAAAAQNNPRLISPGVGNGCTTPSGPHFYPVDETIAGQPLLHAPWPFKTVTAAVAYLEPNGVPVIPYTSVINEIVMKYAIIHCMPGLYRMSSTVEEHNGQVGNGETFPIELPNHVSLQGTSALNTIFELEGKGAAFTAGPIFAFGKNSAHSGVDSFLDCISLFGAPFRVRPTGQGLLHQSSAIYLKPQAPAAPTITNCFFFANAIGILVDSPQSATYATGWHTPTIVNCTLSQNMIGIWNGSVTASAAGQPSVGASHLLLLNNILDGAVILGTYLRNPCSSSPSKLLVDFPETWNSQPFVQGQSSAFEGIEQDAFLTNLASPRDFNAYCSGVPISWNYPFNWGASIGVGNTIMTNIGLIGATYPGVGPNQWSPGIDIRAIAFSPPRQAPTRGILYVRDLIANGHSLGLGPFELRNSGNWVECDFDTCPGDFRLSPGTAPYTSQAGPTISPGDTARGGAPNPCVDAGYFAAISPSNPLPFKNGRVLYYPPGHLDLPNQALWQFDSWAHDCEGFGNRRVFVHPLQHPNVGIGGIDIGADEMDLNIIAGYRFGTTAFMTQHDTSSTPNITAINPAVWILGPPLTYDSTKPSESERPLFTFIPSEGLGQLFPWLLVPPNPRLTWLFDYERTTTPVFYTPTMMDVMPHLLRDVHPFYSGAVNSSLNVFSNPMWQGCLATPAQNYNPFLYFLAGAPIANPPGSFEGASPPGLLWLVDTTGWYPATWATVNEFPDDTDTGKLLKRMNRVKQFSTWCLNEGSGAPGAKSYDSIADIVPQTLGSIPQGVQRYNVEYLNYVDTSVTPVKSYIPYGRYYPNPQSLPFSNLQSFMVIHHYAWQ